MCLDVGMKAIDHLYFWLGLVNGGHQNEMAKKWIIFQKK